MGLIVKDQYHRLKAFMNGQLAMKLSDKNPRSVLQLGHCRIRIQNKAKQMISGSLPMAHRNASFTFFPTNLLRIKVQLAQTEFLDAATADSFAIKKMPNWTWQ